VPSSVSSDPVTYRIHRTLNGPAHDAHGPPPPTNQPAPPHGPTMQPRSPSPLPNSKPPSLSRDDLFFFFRLQKKKRKEKERESQLFVNRTQLLLANQIKSHPTVAAFFAIPLSSSAAAAAAAADAADSPPLPSPPVSASPPSAAWGSRSRFAPPCFLSSLLRRVRAMASSGVQVPATCRCSG
jgi:hypothetical protein